MAFNIEYLVRARDTMSGVMARLGRTVDAVHNKVQRLEAALWRMGETLRKSGRQAMNFGMSMMKYTTLPILAVGGFALKAAADLEQLQVAFETILGSSAAAKKLVMELQTFAAKTPFEMKGVQEAARSLLSAGVPADQIIKKLTMIGDIASGVNIPLEDMAKIYSKINMKGKAQAEELMQLSERGVPVVQLLADHFKVGTDQILKWASKGMITAEIMNKAFESLTGSGGKFGGMMEKQSQTLGGLFSTAKDDIMMNLAVIGQAIDETFDVKGILRAVSSVAQGFREWFTGLSPLARKFLVVIAALVAFLPLLIIGIGSLIFFIGILGPLMTGLGLIMGGLFAPITLIISGLIAFFVVLKVFQTEISDGIEWIINGLMGLVQMVEAAYNWVVDLFSQGIEGLVGFIGGVFEYVGSVIEGIIARVSNGFSAVMSMGSAVAKLATGDVSGAWESGKEAMLYASSAVTGVNLAGQADVNININDRNKNVASASGAGTGGVNLNLGYNMP